MKKTIKSWFASIFALALIVTTGTAWGALPDAAWTWDGSGATQDGALDSGETIYKENNHCVDVANAVTGKAFTYAFWVKRGANGWQDIVSLSTSQRGFKLEWKGAAAAIYKCFSTNGAKESSGVQPATDAENDIAIPADWTHIAFVNNNGGFTLYINGSAYEFNTPLAADTTAWSDVVSEEKITLLLGIGCGYPYNKAAYERGGGQSSFADMKLYDAALTADQVKELYEDYNARAANRLFTANGNWSDTGAWKYGEDQLDAPAASADTTIYVEQDSTITMNAAATLNNLTINGVAKATFAGENKLEVATTAINTDVDVSAIEASLGALTVASGKTLTAGDKTTVTSLSIQGATLTAGTMTIPASPALQNATINITAGKTVQLPNKATINKSGVKINVLEGATLDINGVYDLCPTLTLSNGAVVDNTTESILSGLGGKKQWTGLVLKDAHTTAMLTGNSFYAISGGYGAHNFYLNGGTLKIAMDEGKFYSVHNITFLKNSTETTAEAGTIQVTSGKFEVCRDGNAQYANLVIEGGEVCAVSSYNFGSLAGTGGTLNLQTSGNTLTVGGLNKDTEFAGTLMGPAALTKVGTGTLTLTGTNNHTGALNVNEGAICFATENDLTLSGTVSGSGKIIVDGITLDLTGANLTFTGTYELKNNAILKLPAGKEGNTVVPEGCTLSLTYTGTTDLPYTPTATGEGTIQIVDAEGTVISNEDGVFVPALTGKGTWYEFLFEGTTDEERLANGGVVTQAIRGEDNGTWTFLDMGVTPARQALRIHDKYPWTNTAPTFNSLETWSASFFAKMPKTEGGVLMGFGTTVGGNPGFIALVRGKGENKVLLVSGGACPGNNQVTSFNILADFTVPNAEAAYHLYTFVRTAEGVEIFLDGEPWTPYNQTVTVGNGFQIGSLHGGFCSAGGDWKGYVYAGELTDYTGLTLTRGGSADDTTGAIDMLRIYRRALTAEDVKTLAAEYSYISPDGSYSRTVTEAANWVADDSWTNDADQAGEKLAEPPKGAITLTADAESPVAVTMNLSEDKTFEALTLDGDGVTIAGAEGSAVAHVEGLTKVLCNATIDCGVVEMTGPVRVADGATLTLNASNAMLEQMLDGKIIGTYKHYLTGPAEGTVVPPTSLTYEGWDVSVEQDDTTSWVLTAARANWYVIIAADGTTTLKAGNTLESASEVESIPTESLSAPIYVSAGADGYVALPVGTTPRVEVSGTGAVQLWLASFQTDAHATIGTLEITETATVIVPQNSITVNSKTIADTATIGYSATTDGWAITEWLSGAYGIRIVAGSVTFSGNNGGYSGRVTIDDGASLATSGSATVPFGKGSIVNNGTLTVGGTNGQLPAVSGTGNITITAQTRIAGEISISGTLTVGAETTITNETGDFTNPTLAINGPAIALNGTLTASVDGASVTVASGKTISGTGTLTGDLSLANGATIDATAGKITVTGDVTAEGTVNVTLPEGAAAGTEVLACANAATLDLTKLSAAPASLKWVADGTTIKLATAAVCTDPHGTSYSTINACIEAMAELGATDFYIYIIADTAEEVTLPADSTLTFMATTGNFSGTVKDENGNVLTAEGGTYDTHTYIASVTVTTTEGVEETDCETFDDVLDELEGVEEATVTFLTVNPALTKTWVIDNKDIILDLGNTTVTADWEWTKDNPAAIWVKNGGKLTIKNGTLDTTVEGVRLGVRNGTAGTLEVESNATIKAKDAAVMVYGGSTLISEGTISNADTPYAAIQGNGLDTTPSTITITAGSVTSTQSHAIYHPQPGTLTIGGDEDDQAPTINGMTGIEMRAGTINVKNGWISANAGSYSAEANGNGSTVTGAALAVSQHTTGYDVAVNVTGGLFAANGHGLAVVNLTGNDPVAVTGSIVGSALAYSTALVDIPTVALEGNAETGYTLETRTTGATIGNAWYATLAEAVAAAEEGDTIKLLGDITASDAILVGKSITIDGNGKKLTFSATRAIRLTTAGTTVAIQNLDVVNTLPSGTSDVRGISIDNVGNIALTLTGCTVTGSAYAVNVSGGAGSTLTINGGAYEGVNVINVWGTHTVAIDGATLTSTYPLNTADAGACVRFEATCTATIENTTFNGNNAVAISDKTGDSTVTEDANTDNTTRHVAKVNGTYYNDLTEAITAANGETVVLLASGELAQPVAANFDLNGWNLKGTFAGTLVMNGGKYYSADDHYMAGPEGYYATTDATFVLGETAIEIADGNVSITKDMNTLPGQTLTVAEGVTFTVPAEKTINVLNSTIIVNGTLTIEGALKLGGTYEGTTYTAGSITAAEGLGITSGVSGYDVVYADGNYTLAHSTGALIGDTWYATLAEAVAAAKTGDTIKLMGDVSDAVQLPAGVTLNTNGKNVSAVTDVYGNAITATEGVYTAPAEDAYVAQIGETKYLTLQAAFKAVQDDGTIMVLGNITFTEATVGCVDGQYVDGVRYTGDKSFTVDFNGKTVTDDGCVNDYLIYLNNNGANANEITFKNGTIRSQNGCWSTICVGANASTQKTTLNLNGMTLENKNGVGFGGNCVVRARGNASIETTVNVNSGTTIASDNASYGVASVTAYAVVNVNEGATIVQKNSANSGGNHTCAAVSGLGVINVNGGTIISDKYGVYTMTSGNAVANISGGTITAPTVLAAVTNGGNGQSATINVIGGVFNGELMEYNSDCVLSISGGTYTADPTAYLADGCAALLNLDGMYVVGAKPTATVNNLGAMTIAESDYIVYEGSKSGDMPLNFVMQFLANQNAEDMKTSPYADWYADFVLTFEGLEDGSFEADGCYLAGYYGDIGWVKVPVDAMTIENGVRYPVMLGVNMGQKYNYICSDVKDFRCAMYLTPEVLAANPNLKVKLELSIVDNSKGEDEALKALGNTSLEYVNVVGETEYDAEDFASYVAQIGDVKYTSLQAAIDAATEGQTVQLIADVELAKMVTIAADDDITLDLNGKTINAALNGDSTTNHIYAFDNKGTLTITDTSAEQSGAINSRGVWNYGSLTLEAGKIAAIDGNGGYAMNNEPGSTFVMNGGWLAADNEDGDAPEAGNYDATALDVPAKCTATLNGGKITNAGNFTFAISAAGTLNIPATSTITVEGRHGAINISGGTTTIDAGTFSIPENTVSTDNVIYVSGGSLIINGGTFTGDNDGPSGGTCVCDEVGGATINGGTFGNSSGGDVWGTTGTTIKGGTYENLTETKHIADGFLSSAIVGGGCTVVPRLYIKMVGGEPRIGAKVATISLKAATNLETPVWATITYEPADDVNLDGYFWVKPTLKDNNNTAYRFFKLAN